MSDYWDEGDLWCDFEDPFKLIEFDYLRHVTPKAALFTLEGKGMFWVPRSIIHGVSAVPKGNYIEVEGWFSPEYIKGDSKYPEKRLNVTELFN